MKLLLKGFAVGALLLTATQDLSAMCLATPCYLLKVSAVSTDFHEGSATCLLAGTLVSSKQVECSGVNSFGSFNLSMFDSESALPSQLKFPLQLHEDRTSCESLSTGKEEFLLYAFQDCCDTPGRTCLRGYQVKIVRTQK